MSSEESGIGYRKMYLILTFFALILTTPVGRVWRFTHFYSAAPRKMVRLPSLRSRMTGKYLISFYKKLFYMSAHPCPFRRLSPPPSPDKRGRLFYVSHFLVFQFSYIKNINSFFLSVSFPRNRREVPSLARR